MNINKRTYDFLIKKVYFTGEDHYLFFFSLSPMLKAEKLDSEDKINNTGKCYFIFLCQVKEYTLTFNLFLLAINYIH